MKVIGIDLGGHNTAAAEIDLACGLCGEVVEVPTPSSRTAADVFQTIADIVREVTPEKELLIGIGIPGYLNRSRTRVALLTNFNGINNMELPVLLEAYLEKQGLCASVKMENDANCAALGEGIGGAAQGCADYTVLTLGSGVGSGVVSGGRLLIGAHGMAGEAGHMSVGAEKNLCLCGGFMHLEQSFSADRIEKRAAAAMLPADFKELWTRRSEERIRPLMGDALDTLARSIASLCVVTDPEMIILSGGISRALGLREELLPLVLNYLPIPYRETFDLRISALGSKAALIGAGSLFA